MVFGTVFFWLFGLLNMHWKFLKIVFAEQGHVAETCVTHLFDTLLILIFWRNLFGNSVDKVLQGKVMSEIKLVKIDRSGTVDRLKKQSHLAFVGTVRQLPFIQISKSWPRCCISANCKIYLIVWPLCVCNGWVICRNGLVFPQHQGAVCSNWEVSFQSNSSKLT